MGLTITFGLNSDKLFRKQTIDPLYEMIEGGMFIAIIDGQPLSIDLDDILDTQKPVTVQNIILRTTDKTKI